MYSNYLYSKAMHKRAAVGAILATGAALAAPMVKQTADTIKDLGVFGSCVLLGAASVVGGLGGYAAAKIAAKDNTDIKHIHDAYEAQRLSAELSGLNAKLRYEIAGTKRPAAQPVRSARILGW